MRLFLVVIFFCANRIAFENGDMSELLTVANDTKSDPSASVSSIQNLSVRIDI